MANTTKATAPAEPAAQPTPAAMMTTSAEQAMTIAKARFDDIATKSREAMEMGLKAVDVAAATSRSNVDALLESSRMASGALEAIARDVADYAKQRADRTTAAIANRSRTNLRIVLLQHINQSNDDSNTRTS